MTALFTRDDRRGLYLYQDVVPEEFADLYERTCGRFLGIDELVPHVAYSLDFRNIGDKVTQFDDVVHGAACLFNDIFDIGEDLFGLFFEVVLADQVTRGIQCYLPRNNNRPGIAEIVSKMAGRRAIAFIYLLFENKSTAFISAVAGRARC